LLPDPEPALLPDEEFASIATRLTDARDRAKTIAQKQRREMFGKAAFSEAKAAADNAGSAIKSAVLSTAMKRINKEGVRRHRILAKAKHLGFARRTASAIETAKNL
jgi:hypothetical protein